MLLSSVLKLEAQADGRIPLTHGDLVHAALLDLVKKNLPEDEAFLSWQLHEFARYKPFTVSQLFGNRRMENYQLIIEEEQNFEIRITSLDKTLSECLLALKEKSANLIKIGGVFFDIKEIITDQAEHRWARQTSYQELTKRWSEEIMELPKKLSFRFVSPTAFRDGAQNILFPMPHLIFYSLAEKWLKYAPEPFTQEIQTFQDGMKVWQEKSKTASDKTKVWELLDKLINVSSYNLRTRMLNFREYKRIGFTGTLEFEALPSVPDKWLRILNLLADFSFYGGVGSQTTMGMGQTARLSLARTVDKQEGR